METKYYGIYDEGWCWSVVDGCAYDKAEYTLDDVASLYRDGWKALEG